jgi:hypothetical protein
LEAWNEQAKFFASFAFFCSIVASKRPTTASEGRGSCSRSFAAATSIPVEVHSNDCGIFSPSVESAGGGQQQRSFFNRFSSAKP